MAWAIGASQPDNWAIGASQPTAVVGGGIMTTNTGYWGALIVLLGLLLLIGIPS